MGISDAILYFYCYNLCHKVMFYVHSFLCLSVFVITPNVMDRSLQLMPSFSDSLPRRCLTFFLVTYLPKYKAYQNDFCQL